MNDAPQLYNSRLINVYLLLLAEQYPLVPVSDILAYAGIEHCEAIDESCWLTQKQVDLFVEKTIQLTNNRHIAREAGRLAASPGAIGAMRQYTLGLLGPSKAFQLLNKATKNFTRSADYQSRQIKANQVEITVKPYAGVAEKPFQCQNRKGFFEAIISGFNLGLPQIDHPECLFEGGSCCRYIVTWKKSLAGFFSVLRNVFLFVTLVVFALGLFSLPQTAVLSVAPLLLIPGLLFALFTEIIKRQEMSRSLENLWGSSERLTEVLASSARNLQLVHRVGETLTNKQSIEDVVRTVTEIMEAGLDFDCGAILLANEDNTRLVIRSAFGYSYTEISDLMETSFQLDNPSSEGPLVQSFKQKKAVVINSTLDLRDKLSDKSKAFLDSLGIESFICCPILVDDNPIGVIAVNNQKTGRPLIKSDTTLLQGIAPVIGVALQNAHLIENLQDFFEKTLKVLADSIDARDYMTSGHSEIVTRYAVMIAEELKFAEEEIKTIRIASLLHDYGKIGVPDAVLCKNGPLTTEERAIINTHPAQTEKILNQIPFPAHQADIPRIAGSHHERWDGTGYPRGLKGEEIPLGARILAVADFFEAITARRHYRSPMPVEAAVRLLKEGSGSHFDPAIVDCFLQLLEKDNYSLLQPDAFQAPGSDLLSGSLRSHRVDYQTQVSVQCGRKILNGRTLDISEKGVFVVTDDYIENHASLILTLCPPNSQEFVHIRSEVVWINNDKTPTSQRHPNGFGVRFNEVPQEVLDAIQHFVLQQSRMTLVEARKVRHVSHGK
ncbi:MAG: HD domain-containing phosphohydrolase [Pelovirga sp.]